jgi:DNA-binding transcriptional MerR regulator/methylmalonyl-CoA mutase cobalamin-binding subunit
LPVSGQNLDDKVQGLGPLVKYLSNLCIVIAVTEREGALRIGEFARRAGVNPELLRAWERRYGLLQPVRTEGGFRLYTAEDGERVEEMKRALAEGLSAAEAAGRALAAPARTNEPALEHARERLMAAAHAYDEAAAQAILDEAFAKFGLETVLRELILPALREIGDEWERGELGIGEEHFTTTVIRERLFALARYWSRGAGPLAILACAPEERHDIGLVAFGLVLRSHGWRIFFLGANTPVETVASAATALKSDLAVVTSVDTRLLEAAAGDLRRLGRATRLVLSGAGATEELCKRLRIERLDGDLVAAAETVARA